MRAKKRSGMADSVAVVARAVGEALAEVSKRSVTLSLDYIYA